ncbi:hypothetical protein ABVT39_002754 [Epinephelus coioides]
MPLSNGNTVAAERRMDLASLFCMIGRHGPAVALAVIAIVSVLAGFIIYRTVRGKRRKATAGDGDSGSPGAEKDASVIPPEEAHSSVESTDVSDEGSSDVKQDVEPIQSDLKLRHRRAAPEKKPPLYSPPESGIQVPANKRSTSDNTEEMAAVLDSYEEAETYAEEATPSLLSDTYTEAEMVVEDAVDCQQGETDDVIKDVLEEVHDNDSCWKEPEPISVENHKEEEEVLEAESQEEEDATTDKDVSDKTTREEEENSQCALKSPVHFEQTLNENSNDDRLQDDKTINDKESNSKEPAIHIEDIPIPPICHGEDEEFQEESPDSIDYSSYSSNTHLSPEEEEKNEGDEAKGEYEDQQVIGQQDEIWSSTSEQEINLPSTQQEQCDVTDKVTPPSQDSGRVEDDDLAGEEVTDEDGLNQLTAAKFDTCSSEFDEQNGEIEQEENGLTCDQEDGVLNSDQGEEKMTPDNIVACNEEQNSPSVASSPAVPCLSAPIKVDNHHDGLSGVTTDAKAQISGITELPDSPTDCQPPQKEDEIAPSVDEDADSTALGPQMPSNEPDSQSENNENGTTMVSNKEWDDQVNDPHFQSCYEDQQSVQTKRNEAEEASVAFAPDIVVCDGEIITTPVMAEIFGKASVAVDPETAENIPSVIVEDVSFHQLSSICQDQQSDCIGENEAFDKVRDDSTTGAATCNNASLTALLTSEEKSGSDMLSSSQDLQSDHMENNETFEETKVNSAIEAPACDDAAITSPIISEESQPDMFSSYQDQQSAAPAMTEDTDNPLYQYYLLNLEQCQMGDNNISSACVGEESGISSMTVSPDAGNEFDVIFENMPVPLMNCDLQSKGQSEVQNHLFADDIALSIIKEETAGMVFGPYPSCHSQPTPSQLTYRTSYESFAANEDVFGHEVEESYHRVIDQFCVQIADSVASFTDELEKQRDVKVVVEDVEVKEKKVRVSAENKDETKAEEKEEDYERTEISIMEATMDHNEWIMDSNYQVLPWMNLSAPSFVQDHSKTNQLPTEECQSSSAVMDTTCTYTDIPPSTEVKQTSTLSHVDENTETNKKVVAVQPMTQNVNVTFRIHYLTYSPYQTVAITGNQQELGNWKGFVPLERAKDGHWSVVVSLPAESHVEWKFVVVDKGEVCRWEECGNRLLDTGFGDDLLVHKWWGRL